MARTFGEALREKLDEVGIKPAELSRRAKITKQNIGRILNNTSHGTSGAAPRVEIETVEKIAKALNWQLDDALLSAGYAYGSSGDALSLEIADTVRVSMLHGKKLSEAERDRFETAFKAAYETAKQMNIRAEGETQDE